MNWQKIKQAVIILFTIFTVLALAYAFRTPRSVPVNVVEDAEDDGGNTINHLSDTNNNRVQTENNLPLLKGEEEEEKDDSFQPPSDDNEKLTLEELRMKFLDIPYITDKFTIVTPTYKRTDNLYRALKNYCPQTEIVHKILILWNNVGETIPDKLTQAAADCSVPVVIKVMSKNNLTSRFIPYPEIETTAILSIDDDLILPENSLTLAFKTWQQYPYLLVGYTPRTYSYKNGYYKYIIHGTKTYTMIMTNVAFIHRLYLELFVNTVPKLITDYIIKTTNGEDITMNVVIGKYLTEQGHAQPVGIKMSSSKLEIGNLSKSGYKGLWHRSGHQHQRTQCLNLLKEAYGKLYLEETNKSVSDISEI